MSVQSRPRTDKPIVTVDRIERVIAIVGGALVVAGIALIYAPAALVVAGLLLLASVIDLRRPTR